MVCSAPDPGLGTALRLERYLDCNAQLLGREGFLSLSSTGFSDGVVLGVLTISVALIGYRLMFGDPFGVREGTSWLAKVGLVLALLGTWQPFQTLFYDIAIAAPQRIGGDILQVTGESRADPIMRIQRSYDQIRLGVVMPAAYADASVADGANRFQRPATQTATVFLVLTAGIEGILRLLAGFLLAIGPFPVLAILFTSTWGLFIGWIRALVTTVFAATGVIVVNRLHLVAVEAELDRLQNPVGIPSAAQIDFQAMSAIIAVFAILSLAMMFSAARLAGSISALLAPLPIVRTSLANQVSGEPRDTLRSTPAKSTLASKTLLERDSRQERVVQITDALERMVNRSEAGVATASGTVPSPVDAGSSTNANAGRADHYSDPSAAARALGRRHRSARRRDMTE